MLQTSSIILKILIIGTDEVGKTSIIKRLTDNTFVPQILPTIGVDFSLTNILLLPDTAVTSIPVSITMQLWDIAGQKNFQAIIPYYIDGTQGILLTCDSTNPVTLTALDEYLDLINLYLDTSDIPKMLISTKHDLPVVLKQSDIEEFLHRHLIYEYFPTSAVTGLNINAVFQHIGQLIVKITLLL